MQDFFKINARIMHFLATSLARFELREHWSTMTNTMNLCQERIYPGYSRQKPIWLVSSFADLFIEHNQDPILSTFVRVADFFGGLYEKCSTLLQIISPALFLLPYPWPTCQLSCVIFLIISNCFEKRNEA